MGDDRTEDEVSDSLVDKLKKKYLQDSLLSAIQQGHTMESDIPSDYLSCSPSNSLSESEKLHYERAMRDLKKLLKSSRSLMQGNRTDVDHSDGVVDDKSKSCDSDASNEVTKDIFVPRIDIGHDSAENTLTESATLPTMSSEFTLGTDISPMKQRKSVRISAEPATFLNSEFSSGFESTWPAPGILRTSSEAHRLEATDVKVIHAELMNIHRKLIEKSEHLAERQEELSERERELTQREDNVADQEEMLEFNLDRVRRAQDVMVRLQGVEAEVEEKLDILQENHIQEVDEMSCALNEKLKEVKRMRNSFDALKLQNDDLKLQTKDLSEQNQRMQMQNLKLKKRLENLQRKQDYEMQKKSNLQILAERQGLQQIPKTKPDEAPTKFTKIASLNRSGKIWNNSVESLSVLLQWVCEVYLQPMMVQKKYDIHAKALYTSKEFVTDKCLKVLPMLVEVIRYLPISTTHHIHHLPYLQFVYWSLHHLEDVHHAILTSTARRIGEELFKPTVSRPQQLDENATMIASHNSSIQFVGQTGEVGKGRIFFNSPNPEVRLLSALIILHTLQQVDVLAQIFDQLKKDLKDEANRKLFLKYSSVKSILPYLTYKANKALLGNSIDLMLQMSMESDLLSEFLESVSCDVWFKAVSTALREIIKSSDNTTLEKLCVILQKLSKNKNNRKLFETYSIGRMLLEKHRDCDPENSFLAMNLRSILVNINMIK